MESAASPVSPADRHRLAKSVFLSCRELTEPARSRELERHCEGDAELMAAVEDLLSADGQAGGFLEGQPAWRHEVDSPEARLEGRVLGPYRIERPLGAGGMGLVYLASRADGEFERQVAIKVLRGSLGSREGVRRFRAERQILAQLHHPFIAELLDGGSTEDGLIFLVMELVEGVPLDRFCRDHRLGLGERLELFSKVCAAVQFAHQNLIIHRDLKPANILVSASGEPKLLDFGIAKLLSDDGLGWGATPTATLERALTPEYASPEQVRGDPVNTATDIYSLGVLLYELLTDGRPYRVRGETGTLRADLWVRAVCEQEPERPSTAALRRQDSELEGWSFPEPPYRLARRLATDLDTIVLKSLRKEPRLRYSSVEQLAEDLRRSRQGLPILARPATLGYRCRKFCQRSPLLAAAAGVVILLTVGLGLLSMALVRQRDRADREREKSEQVAKFTTGLFWASEPEEAQGREVTARDLLETGVGRIQAELRDQPETRAAVLEVLGSAFFNLGDFTRAEPLLTEALEERRRLPGVSPRHLAESLDDLAGLYRERGEPGRAEPLYREALAVLRAAGDKPDLGLAEALNNLGVLLAQKGDSAAATPLIQEALDVTRSALGPRHPQVAGALNNLAGLLRSRGDLAAAGPLLEEALEIRREALGDLHPDVNSALFNLAMLQAELGRYQQAEAQFRRSFTHLRQVLGTQHPRVSLMAHGWAGKILRLGRPREATELLEPALEASRKALPADHTDLLAMLNTLGRAWLELGESEAAERLLLEASRLAGRPDPPEPRQRAATERHLGMLRLAQGRHAEAEALLRRAWTRVEEVLPRDHPDRAAAEGDLALWLESRGRLPEASSLAERAYSRLEGLRGRGHPEVLPYGLLVADLRCRSQQRLEGRALLSALVSASGPELSASSTLHEQAKILVELCESRGAARSSVVREAMFELERKLGPQAPLLARLRSRLISEAEPLSRSARE